MRQTFFILVNRLGSIRAHRSCDDHISSGSLKNRLARKFAHACHREQRETKNGQRNSSSQRTQKTISKIVVCRLISWSFNNMHAKLISLPDGSSKLKSWSLSMINIYVKMVIIMNYCAFKSACTSSLKCYFQSRGSLGLLEILRVVAQLRVSPLFPIFFWPPLSLLFVHFMLRVTLRIEIRVICEALMRNMN